MGISMPQLLIIIAIVVLLFGTKKLRSLGSDLGESVKGKPQDASFEKVESKAAESAEQKAKEKEQA